MATLRVPIGELWQQGVGNLSPDVETNYEAEGPGVLPAENASILEVPYTGACLKTDTFGGATPVTVAMPEQYSESY